MKEEVIAVSCIMERESGELMFKFANNSIFWMTFLSMMLGLASVNAINSVYALDLAALDFVVWLAFVWVRSSYAARKRIVLPSPDGVWIPAEKGLQVMPAAYLGTVCAVNFAACLLAGCWWGALFVAVAGTIGGLSCRRH